MIDKFEKVVSDTLAWAMTGMFTFGFIVGIIVAILVHGLLEVVL